MLMESEVLGGVMLGGVFKIVSEFESHIGPKRFFKHQMIKLIHYISVYLFSL